MHRQEQDMLLLIQPQQADPQEETLSQVEGLLDLCSRQPLGFTIALGLGQRLQVLYRQGQVRGRGDDLHGLPLDDSKGGPQGFMASKNLIAALLQSRHDERTRQTYGIEYIEQRCARKYLVELQQLFLRN